METVITAIVALAAGLAGGFLAARKRVEDQTEQARRQAEHILEEARKQSEEHVRRAEELGRKATQIAEKAEAERLKAAEDELRKAQEARREASEAKRDGEELRRRSQEALARAEEEAARTLARAHATEAESKEQRAEVLRLQTRLVEKEQHIDRKADLLNGREADLLRRDRETAERERRSQAREAEVGQLHGAAHARLEEVAGLTRAEATRRIVEDVEEDARIEAARRLKRIEEETRADADRRAKRLISTAVMRYAGEYVFDRVVSVVALPSDDMKGRIIGREGRNIRAFETATGTDVIIDDTPEAVVLSCFNPVRREVARLSLEALIKDGRIHPTRIEEVVEKTRAEVDQTIQEAGEYAVFELGLQTVHADLVKVIGRLKYRTSYAQNVLAHSIEVGFLAGIMAGELGLDVKMARRAGLLHDIGKAVDHEVEGPHAMIGAQLCRKYGESPEVVKAVAAHHEDEPADTILAQLVYAADALSSARPGARRETMENYIKRLEDLEAIGRSFDGVERSFAIQAGREIRVMVENSEVSDEAAVLLCRDIAKRIEEKLTYPGQIKVTVIRETRAVDYAK
ncbi:MAG: ribonuclease Y [Myxococcales bacterium]